VQESALSDGGAEATSDRSGWFLDVNDHILSSSLFERQTSRGKDDAVIPGQGVILPDFGIDAFGCTGPVPSLRHRRASGRLKRRTTRYRKEKRYISHHRPGGLFNQSCIILSSAQSCNIWSNHCTQPVVEDRGHQEKDNPHSWHYPPRPHWRALALLRPDDHGRFLRVEVQSAEKDTNRVLLHSAPTSTGLMR